MSEKAIILRAGREKSVLLRHPWIFASAVAEVVGDPDSGDTVYILDSKKQKLGLAAYSPNSQIRARLWSWNPNEKIDKNFFEARIIDSIQRRNQFTVSEKTNAMRLIYGEADGLPGLIVDKYDQTFVAQILSTGPEKFRNEIFSILEKVLIPELLFERSDVDVRVLEGLSERKGIISGDITKNVVIIEENNIKYLVDVSEGQKTGFFIDQRRNRNRIMEYAKEKEVLNCFCYTGGFTLNAMAGEAKSVLSIDSSSSALEQLERNFQINHFSNIENQYIEGDVFKLLRLFRDQDRHFDMIILDPPKFAPTTAQAEKAARGYKDINLLAIKMLRPGGILATFSCSGGISRELFQKIVTGAAHDAGSDLRILETLSQSPDHPISMNFPESFYLKGLICQK